MKSSVLSGFYRHCIFMTDFERAIMIQLQKTILRHSQKLFDVMAVAAELDWWASRSFSLFPLISPAQNKIFTWVYRKMLSIFSKM